jgi:hypothetical protein
VQVQQQHLDSLRLQQRLMFAISWTRLELRPAGAQGQALWLRNASNSGTIRVTFRRPVLASSGGPLPAAEVRTLSAGEEINLGTRLPADRVLHEAQILGAEWIRGGPPPGIRIVSSSELREAEQRLHELEHAAAAALAAQRPAEDAHARALRELRAARTAEAPHERALTNHRRTIERLNREQVLLTAQIREAQRSLATSRAYYERLLKRRQEQESR